MKSMLTVKNISIFALVVMAIVTVVYYFSQTQSQNDLLAEDRDIFLFTDVNLSYDDFLNDLEQDCPYYEPNGARYRECLVDLLTQREQGVDQYQADLIRDIQAITDSEFQTTRLTFISHLEELGDIWKPYRDQLCITTFDSMWGGSNQGGATNTCRLYETERHRILIGKLRAEWIR